MRVLVVGSGGREHALAWKLAQSQKVTAIYCAPGNAGTTAVAKNLPVAVLDIPGLTKAAVEQAIDLVVVGPEAPLALGLADSLREEGIAVFGPSQAAARIETSKSWAKAIMAAAGVPTARSVTVEDVDAAYAALGDFAEPLVIKADGLAAGKGVVVAETRETARQAIDSMMIEESLGEAGASIVIEEFLLGTEVSLFALTDGNSIRMLLPSCDYKRACDDDQGPNTGGMGAYAPAPFVDSKTMEQFEYDILRPTITAMDAAGSPMNGVLYAGLMMTATGPMVVEFNCRFGDPETEVVLPLMTSDLADLLHATATGNLDNAAPITWSDDVATGVVMASGGYPGHYVNGMAISGLESASQQALVFHAGTRFESEKVVTAGGRVLVVVGQGSDFDASRTRAYAGVDQIAFADAIYRTDIAARETT